jgi:hypothetical protein
LSWRYGHSRSPLGPCPWPCCTLARGLVLALRPQPVPAWVLAIGLVTGLQGILSWRYGHNRFLLGPCHWPCYRPAGDLVLAVRPQPVPLGSLPLALLQACSGSCPGPTATACPCWIPDLGLVTALQGTLPWRYGHGRVQAHHGWTLALLAARLSLLSRFLQQASSGSA